MTVRRANCPACGGPVEFHQRSSLVTVCEFCQSAVARGDRTVEDWGKVADLVYTGSPLQLGLKGKYEGKRFELVGHVQYQHAAGGVWDEWYAAFPGGRWGWLAEAQGRFYLTFRKPLSEKTPLPPVEELEPGREFTFPEIGPLSVAEVGQAQVAGAEGEIPFPLHPGEVHRYADLYGPEGRFATFDYGEEPAGCFLGREVSLADIGITEDAKFPDRPSLVVPAKQLNCPQCAGPLTLRVPDKTERMACPNCAALLDLQEGDLKYLLTLRSHKVPVRIPLGTVGTYEGVEYTVIGMMERFMVYAGMKYPWTEYLLYQPREGFRWLVHSDRHWSFVRPLSPGDVRELARTTEYQGTTFKLFQDATATVRYVVGEFYWRVEVGEQVRVRDFIAPPHMLSIEKSGAVGEPGRTQAQEINYSLATYMPHEEVERIFGVKNLPRGWGIAPNEPSPVGNRVFLSWLALGGVLLAINVLASALLSMNVDQWLFFYALVFVSLIPAGAAFYKHSVEVSRWSESDFNPYQTE